MARLGLGRGSRTVGTAHGAGCDAAVRARIHAHVPGAPVDRLRREPRHAGHRLERLGHRRRRRIVLHEAEVPDPGAADDAEVRATDVEDRGGGDDGLQR
ncbi:MAG: hypothetical protein ACK559_01980, partial [bacterium]